MFQFTGKIRYTDGREQTFEAGNAALAAWERYAVRNGLPIGTASPPTLSSLVIAHHGLGIEIGVDAWIETVDGIELDANEDGKPLEIPPTLREASTG